MKGKVPANGNWKKWKQVVASGMYHAGVMGVLRAVATAYSVDTQGTIPRWRRTSGPKFVILCYHRIGTGGVPLYSSVKTDVFEAQIRFLKKRYRIMSLDEVCDELQRPTPSSRTGIAITFDDGYRGTYTCAFPILKKYNVPATVYLISGSMESGEVAWYDRIFLALRIIPSATLQIELDCPRTFSLAGIQCRHEAALAIIAYMRTVPDLRRKEICAWLERQVVLPREQIQGAMLNWEQVHEMQHSGISFGSHTVTHPVVSQLNELEMQHELADSKKFLEEKLGSAVTHFAFPFGKKEDCGTGAELILQHCGYRSAVTTICGYNELNTNVVELRRVQVGEDSPAAFALKLNRAFMGINSDQSSHPGTTWPAMETQ